METVQMYLILKKPTKRINEFIDELINEQDLVEAIEKKLFNFINLVIEELHSKGLLNRVLVHNVSPNRIVKMIKKVEKSKIDELEKEILLTILYFDYWKIKCVLEEGLNKYLEKSLKNLNAILNQYRLAIWLLLVRKNKEKVSKYIEQIKELINKIEEAMIEFIPEEEFEVEETSSKSNADSNDLVEWNKVRSLR